MLRNFVIGFVVGFILWNVASALFGLVVAALVLFG